MYTNTQTTKVVTTSAPSTFTSFFRIVAFFARVISWTKLPHNNCMVVETHDFAEWSYPTIDTRPVRGPGERNGSCKVPVPSNSQELLPWKHALWGCAEQKGMVLRQVLTAVLLTLFFVHSSFISYTMAVIAVNFMLPLFVMFYCYYNVSVTVKRYKANNCLDNINIEWSEQMDVTKVSSWNQSDLMWDLSSSYAQVQIDKCRALHENGRAHNFLPYIQLINEGLCFLAELLIQTLLHDRLCCILIIVSQLKDCVRLYTKRRKSLLTLVLGLVCTMAWSDVLL